MNAHSDGLRRTSVAPTHGDTLDLDMHRKPKTYEVGVFSATHSRLLHATTYTFQTQRNALVRSCLIGRITTATNSDSERPQV